MTIRNLGPMPAELERDHEGHRTYSVKYKVSSDNFDDGPANVIQFMDSEIPVGSYWNIGTDVDIWAFRLFTSKVMSRGSDVGEKTKHWMVEYTFSTKNPNRCNDTKVENPLLEPPRISGSYTTDREEFTEDRFGKKLVNSAWEALKGPTVEFDRSNITIKIEQNVASPYLAYELPYQMMDTVNKYPIWGFEPRHVKLSAAPFEKKYFGTCFPYYSRTLEFKMRADGFDRDILDEGTKVLHGHWGGTFRRLGTITAGSTAVTGMVSTQNLANAQVSGTGIASGTTVREVTGATTLTLSAVATASGTVFLTFTSSQWILDQIDGQLPDAGNPNHFDQFLDRQGNPGVVVLNGFGIPADVVQGNRGVTWYMVIDTVFGRPATDTAFFVELRGTPPGSDPDFTSPPLWDGKVAWERGSLVNYLGQTYLAIRDVSRPPPLEINPNPTFDDTRWLSVNPNNMGQLVNDPLVIYSPGDYGYTDSFETKTSAGSVHVEAYQESDFLELGIPVTL